MKRAALTAGLVMAIALAAPPLAKTEAERRILAVLDQARSSGEVYLEVPIADGRMLRLLTEAAGARNVVEIGTSTGYSGLWLCLALQKTGGKLTTFEIDPGRAAEARKHFQQAGVGPMVTVVEGDAHENVKRLKEPIDVVFIDADKQGYVDYLSRLLPLVRPGGLILAHNVDSAPEYVRAVTTNPDLETVFYMQGAGLGVTLKKR
ncbi:MAG: O-methyltransferase [Bryobacteraceae bacterium]|jgi:predicted O-methyltransferase YrrM